MFRTAFLTSLVILALALALPAQSSAAESPQEAMGTPSESRGTEGNLHNDDMANELAAVVCSDTGSAPPYGYGTDGQELKQEPIRAPREGANPKDLSREAGQGEGGNLHKELAHKAEPKFQTIPVSPGQNPRDLCRRAHLELGYILYKTPVNGVFKAPTIPGDWPPPAGWDELEMQLNKEAQMKLDAIAAAKLRNKTSGQQTTGQQPP